MSPSGRIRTTRSRSVEIVRLAVSALFIACAPGDDWKPSRPGEIFRHTTVGNSFPLDSIRLGQPWPSASKYAAGATDTLTALPPGTFGGADAIEVHRNTDGMVTRIDFLYRASRDVEVLLADYRVSLGPPSAAATDTVERSVRSTTRWENDDTEFVFTTVSPPDTNGVAARASLIDRPKRSP